MNNFHEGNFWIFWGAYTALERTKAPSQNTFNKNIGAQAQFFINNSDVYNEEFQENCTTLLMEAMYKFNIASYFLETLHGVQNYIDKPKFGLPDDFDSEFTNQETNISFIFSSLLDQSLYSRRSFLDFYLKYLVYFTTGKSIENVSTKSFRIQMQKAIKEKIGLKPQKIWDYISQNVLCSTYEGNQRLWGDLLRSLRDKTTHKKLIRPTIKKKINQEGYEISWPQIQGYSYRMLVQHNFENKAYEMLLDLFEILYEFPWVTGPYKQGMFE